MTGLAYRMQNPGPVKESNFTGRQLEVLLNQQDGVAVHLLFVVTQHFDRVTDAAHSAENIDSQRFRAGAGIILIDAGNPFSSAGGAKASLVHEEHKGLVIAGQKNLPFQFFLVADYCHPPSTWLIDVSTGFSIILLSPGTACMPVMVNS